MSQNRHSSEEHLYYLTDHLSSKGGEAQMNQRTANMHRFQFKRRSSSYLPSRGYSSDVPFDDD